MSNSVALNPPDVTRTAGHVDVNSLQVVPVRHWGRMISAAVLIAIVAYCAYGFAVNPNIEWSVVGDFLLDGGVLRGLLMTLEMTVLGVGIAVILAVVIGVMRISDSKILSGFASIWIFFFRGIPLVVLLIFVGNLGLFIETISIANPFGSEPLVSFQVQQVITPFVASVIALALTGSGYMAEIVRAGLLSVGVGQHEAAKALGVDGTLTLRYIVLPQALRIIIPPLGNELIGGLKASAIVSVIAGGDLMTAVLGISGVNFRTIEMLIVATIWYLLVIVLLSIGQHFLERRATTR
ncbi:MULTISPECIES: amino acid ABC transporter permease [Gordonia]|uniref:Amino acid ABC transporter permease n=1 Tax=Gordonia rubripertincta TaxID=36822 RepID=A0AAW4G308_GORRU|nr:MULTISPECIES: amino acid ABC transporter permease [Gordonia]MBM7277468.1 amino acid ABC transporter permease [Gordonia rubripertincta]MCK8615960.1 amino acid ABC transporter permease [Gordonia sp. C13]